MKIQSFTIENFRNIKLAECSKVPNFMVICGGNGSGKSALLEALIIAKERAGGLGSFRFDNSMVSANSSKTTLSMKLLFEDNDRRFIKDELGYDCPPEYEFIIEFARDQHPKELKYGAHMKGLLREYSKSSCSSGFFDYFYPHRKITKTTISNWNSGFLSITRAKQTLAIREGKFNMTKSYLAGLKMKDLQEIQMNQKSGKSVEIDSLQHIRSFFNSFFKPMEFVDVVITDTPFKFIVSTPMGNIDIDDLSSGEKEIINMFIRYQYLNPKGSVILLDEADAHLHPEFQRRYFQLLRKFAEENQILITTHSPEIMMEAETDSLYAILKQPQDTRANQLIRITDSEEVHNTLSDLMGTKGILGFRKKVIFIEGEEASADKEIYEKFYPPQDYNISFVPAGNSLNILKTAEKVNELLSRPLEFQQFFCIVDGDIERIEPSDHGLNRLFYLPLYHVENLLLDENIIFDITKSSLASDCPYNNPNDVAVELQNLVLSENHLKAYTKALLNSRILKLAKKAYDSVFKQEAFDPEKLEFSDMMPEAKKILGKAIKNETWQSICQGRSLIKSYCNKHGFTYKHFRNSIISKMRKPPKQIDDIMTRILEA